jgi:hypothetical protein
LGRDWRVRAGFGLRLSGFDFNASVGFEVSPKPES